MKNLYRTPNGPRPSAEQLAEWEDEAARVYAVYLDRTTTRTMARETQKDVRHSQRILVLVAEVARLQAELAQANAQIEQVIAQRDAQQAKLVWAEGELSNVWKALSGR